MSSGDGGSGEIRGIGEGLRGGLLFGGCGGVWGRRGGIVRAESNYRSNLVLNRQNAQRIALFWEGGAKPSDNGPVSISSRREEVWMFSLVSDLVNKSSGGPIRVIASWAVNTPYVNATIFPPSKSTEIRSFGTISAHNTLSSSPCPFDAFRFERFFELSRRRISAQECASKMTRLVARHGGSVLWKRLRRSLSEAVEGVLGGMGNLKAMPGQERM